MPRRKPIAIALASLVALAVGAWRCTPDEPSYQGKRLSKWLDDQHWVDGGRVELSDAAVRAVRALGTNAVPHLLAMLRATDSPLKQRVGIFLERRSSKPFRIELAGVKHIRAMYGFRALGPVAKRYYPEIVQIVLHGSEQAHGMAIGSMPDADESTVLQLAAGLSSPDPDVRMRAVFALGCHRVAPAVSVQALIRMLRDSVPEIRGRAAGSLAGYQEVARSAIPALLDLSHDTNAYVSFKVADALKSIRTSSDLRLH
jgi:hypothetical protein